MKKPSTLDRLLLLFENEVKELRKKNKELQATIKNALSAIDGDGDSHDRLVATAKILLGKQP